MTPEPPTGRWRHAFVYFWLLFATAFALLDDPPSPAGAVLSLALVALLGGWYWYWQVAGAADGVARRGVYLAGAVAAWASLVVLDTTFLLAGVSVLAPLGFGSAGWTLALLVPCTGAWLWREVVADGGLDWAQVTVALLVVGSGVAVAGYVGALARQNAERQPDRSRVAMPSAWKGS